MEISEEKYQLLKSNLNLLEGGLEEKDKLLKEKEATIALLTAENEKLKIELGRTFELGRIFKDKQTGADYSDENKSLIAGLRVRDQ